MSKLMEVAEKELIRREILEMAQMTAPEGANLRLLRAALRRVGHDLTEDEIERQVGYLQGKGLVDRNPVENRTLGIRRVIVRITADGTDFLEGNKEVAGVDA